MAYFGGNLEVVCGTHSSLFPKGKYTYTVYYVNLPIPILCEPHHVKVDNSCTGYTSQNSTEQRNVSPTT